MTAPYPVGPNKATIAHFKAGGGAIGWAPGQTWIWSQRCKVHLIAGFAHIGATPMPSGLVQEIDLSVAFPQNVFPTNVQRLEPYIRRVADFAGGAISEVTALVGDTGDPNGLLTSTSVFTGVGAGHTETVGAAEWAPILETAFVPTLTLTSVTANLRNLQSGELWVCIPFRPLHD